MPKKLTTKNVKTSNARRGWSVEESDTGVEKIADHGTNGPRNFSQVSRKNEKGKEREINLEKQINGKSIFCQDHKSCFN